MRDPQRGTREIEDEVVVGTVARLAPQKGIGYLVEAAELVVRDLLASREHGEGVPIRFSVAGDGPLRAALERDVASRELLRDRFVFVGAVDEPWNHLVGLDVFVMPSVYEGMAYVLLEAMGAGLPVVASDVGGVADLIPPGGGYGESRKRRDPRDLADGILRYLRDPRARPRCGRNARRRVERRHSIERMVDEVLEVYGQEQRVGIR